jgi:hypothetical protein
MGVEVGGWGMAVGAWAGAVMAVAKVAKARRAEGATSWQRQRNQGDESSEREQGADRAAP